MNEQRRTLDRLRGEYEAASDELRAARRDGVLSVVDRALLRFQDAEAAYHDALYGRAPGMAGDDRTQAAEALRDRVQEYWVQSQQDMTFDMTRRNAEREEG